MERKVVRRVKLKKTPMVVLLFMMLGITSLIAVQYSLFLQNDKEAGKHFLPASDSSQQVSSLTSPSQASSKPASSAMPGNSSAPVPKKEKIETVVPETVPVGDDYFKDALFIGDSISVGLRIYGVIPESNVIADQNAALYQIMQDKDIYYISATEKTTLWKAIEKKIPAPKKVYILLGTNGISGYENGKHIEYYADLMDKLKAKFPDALIYIQSVTPVTKKVSDNGKGLTSAKINEFNEQLLKLTQEKGLYYLKVEEVFKNGEGYLKDEYDGGDGIHLPRAGHEALYRYYKNHVAGTDGLAEVITP